METADEWKLPDLSSIGTEQPTDGETAVETLEPSLEDLPRPNGFEDDRDDLQPGDRVVLIIEDDGSFAHILLDLARDKGTHIGQTRSPSTSTCRASMGGPCSTV
jgi:hypothetical protein